MKYRALNTEDEIPIAAELQARAFRESPARYLEAYNTPRRFDWRALRLFENDQGEAVAALTVFQRPMSLNGGELNAGLIASVGVPPEQRRRGYARHMMQGLLEELHNQRLPLSLLYPFATAFYHEVGYGLANYQWYLDIPPRYLPDFRERLAVRRATKADLAGMRACYEQARQQPSNNGWFGRTDWEWENRVWREEYDAAVYLADGHVKGYLIYTLTFDRQAGVTSAKVMEWVYTADEGWRGLVGFLAALVEQATVITYNAPEGSPLLLALREPYSHVGGSAEFVYRQAARLVSGFMARVVHLPGALRERRYPATLSAQWVIRINDPQLPINSEPLHVHIAEGRASVAPASGPFNRGQGATLETDIATFSQLFVGFTTAEHARTIGRLHASDEVCAQLTTAFAAAPLFLHQADWF